MRRAHGIKYKMNGGTGSSIKIYASVDTDSLSQRMICYVKNTVSKKFLPVVKWAFGDTKYATNSPITSGSAPSQSGGICVIYMMANCLVRTNFKKNSQPTILATEPGPPCLSSSGCEAEKNFKLDLSSLSYGYLTQRSMYKSGRIGIDSNLVWAQFLGQIHMLSSDRLCSVSPTDRQPESIHGRLLSKRYILRRWVNLCVTM